MSNTIHGFTQWQTGRIVATDDTPLTNYNAADLTAAVKAKMIGIHPATAIILRAFGKDTDGDDATLIISAWMDSGKPHGSGPGHRLWKGVLTLGSHSSSQVPNADHKWGAAATWFEVDTYTSTYDAVGDTILDSALTGGVANQEAVLILPTLGYTHLLMEVTDLGGVGEMTEIGLLWRPARVGEVILTF